MRPRARARKAPRPLEPRGVQLAYYAEIKRVLSYARKLVNDRLLPLLPKLFERAAEQRGDRMDAQAPGKRVNVTLDRISTSFYKAFPAERLEKLTAKVARSTSDHQRDQLFRQIKAVIGVELSTLADRRLGALVRQFTAENVALIETLPQRYFDRIERTVLAGMGAGARHEDVAKEIEAEFGATEEQAALIARDQVLSFNGDLNQIRQQDLGVDRYIWRAVPDNRTREEHVERDGEIYSWDDPPGDPSDPAIGGHPGDAINCRCYAEPYLDDILEEVSQ